MAAAPHQAERESIAAGAGTSRNRRGSSARAAARSSRRRAIRLRLPREGAAAMPASPRGRRRSDSIPRSAIPAIPSVRAPTGEAAWSKSSGVACRPRENRRSTPRSPEAARPRRRSADNPATPGSCDGSKWLRRAADTERQRSSRRFSRAGLTGRGRIVLQRLVAIFDVDGSGVETVFPEIANERRHAAVRDECAGRASRLDRLQQTRPVRMVGKRKPLVDAAPAAIAAHLHPAARKCVGMAAEPPEPRAARRRWRREHECALELLLVQPVAHHESARQGDAAFAVDRVERFYRAMADDRSDFGVDVSENALRFAEAVSQHDARAPPIGVLAPPAIDFVENFALRPPMVDRKAERRFGDERVATHRRESRASSVRLELVIARSDPDLAAKLHAYLCGSQYVAGRMQRNFHAVSVDGFAIIDTLHGRVAQPSQQNGNAIALAEIGFAAPTRVIGMPVRDDCARYRTPGIDVKVSRRTVEAFGTRNDQIHRGIWQGLSGSVPVICTNAAKTSLPRRLEVVSGRQQVMESSSPSLRATAKQPKPSRPWRPPGLLRCARNDG